MRIKRFVIASIALAGLAAGGPALAQNTKWYIGGGIGQSKADVDEVSVSRQFLTIPGVTAATTTSDDSDTGWKIFAGYQFHPNFAVELSYADLGKFSFVTRTTPAATFTGESKVDTNWSGDLVGTYPVGNNFSLLGRVGLLYSETKFSFTGVGPGGTAAVSTKDNSTNWKLGLGVGYEFNNQIGIRGEWERYRVPDGTGDKGDVDLWSVSLRFKF